jgi:hypothetical protein
MWASVIRHLAEEGLTSVRSVGSVPLSKENKATGIIPYIHINQSKHLRKQFCLTLIFYPKQSFYNKSGLRHSAGNKPLTLPSMKTRLISYPIIALFISLTVISCSQKLDTEGLNIENWKEDRYGCKGLRIQDMEELERIKNNFLGASNQALIKTFGRPDRVELVDKSQSFFFYFLEPSPENCDGVKREKEPLKVLFRMNAISKVSEVTITDLNP